MPMFTVDTALTKLNLSAEAAKAIQDKTDIWETFGKKNSNLLRAKLFKLFDAENMSKEARMMIFVLFAAIKNLKRVKEHLENLPDDITSLKEMAEARSFMDRRLVQYVTQENPTKFAVVHLPTTMPGLDLLLTAMMNDYDDDFPTEELIPKMTFTQMDINEDLQLANKNAQMEFWNETVTTSNNPNQDIYRQNKGFNLKFYNTAASDKYDFLNPDMTVFKTPKTGMTEELLEEWYRKVKGVKTPVTRTPATTARS
jgi:ribosomal protein S15P/S13E